MIASIKVSEPLKVAVLSSASGGGAGIAARRVTEALNICPSIQADFIDLVTLGGRVPDDVALPGNMSNRMISDTHFTVEFPGYIRGWVVDLLRQYDVLNIHWASFLLGLAEIDELSCLGMPILFTCHDYYYFTGGCHYPATCDKLSKACVACPQVNQDYCSTSVIAQNRKIKKRILARSNVHLSAPSRFLTDEAVRAEMIQSERAHVLRNPYFPIQVPDRDERGSPPRIVLMADSMTERRKAMPLAIESLGIAFQKLRVESGESKPFIVEIIGNADKVFRVAVEKAGFPHQMHGRISDHSKIARLLNKYDFLLTCSLEDNWPNVLVEAGAYGVVPIVGPGHGCEEFVRRFSCGEVAADYRPDSLARAIVRALRTITDESRIRFRDGVIWEHQPERIADMYLETMNLIIAQGEARFAQLADTVFLTL